MNDELHLYTNGTDTVVARDADDAWTVWEQWSGESRADYAESFVWTLIPSDKPVAILCDDDGEISDSGDVVELQAAVWAEREGRGFLCSTEY